MQAFRTLLVEDDPVFRGMVADLLHGEFPEILVDEAGDGSSALSKVHTAPPNVVFMDIQLPGQNGLALTGTIKKLNSDIVIVIVSNCDLPEYRQAAFRQGADCYILKGSAACSEEILAQVEGVMANSF